MEPDRVGTGQVRGLAVAPGGIACTRDEAAPSLVNLDQAALAGLDGRGYTVLEVFPRERHMNVLPTAGLLAGGLFLGILLMAEIGLRVGARRMARDPKGAGAGVGAIGGAIFFLLGLFIAFTFQGAAARFDARRQLIVEEANAISTAYLRLDLLPSGAQPAMRELFREYLDSRLDIYRKLPDIQVAKTELARSAALQREIWGRALAATREPNIPSATTMLLSALNQMIEITTTRTMATQLHPPAIVFWMLGLLVLVSALLAGYGMAGAKARSWLHVLGFAATVAVTVYVILDYEHPRAGVIRVDAFDQVLMDLRQSMR